MRQIYSSLVGTFNLCNGFVLSWVISELLYFALCVMMLLSVNGSERSIAHLRELYARSNEHTLEMIQFHYNTTPIHLWNSVKVESVKGMAN